jgi:hypothetical protein
LFLGLSACLFLHLLIAYNDANLITPHSYYSIFIQTHRFVFPKNTSYLPKIEETFKKNTLKVWDIRFPKLIDEIPISIVFTNLSNELCI